ncbi:MAG: lysine-2,3-aminomutase-like protein [Bauldia sp.]|nr:lysine-2,3-aminomutase-like protein [Bauldia sp.]
MARTLRTIDELAGARLLAPTPELEDVAARYAVALTEDVLRLIDLTDPDDPIARQFVPDARELGTRPEERSDPIGDGAHSPVKGIVHRYPDRVLLKPILTCPVYCRFCFRREFVGPGADALDPAELDAAIAYIANTPDIWEVIVTGGDPLMLSPRRIRALNAALSAIPHVKVVRWHSRVPIVDPGRVTEELAEALASTARTVWLAVHCNHPRELSAEAAAALSRLRRAGVTLVSQTVLLKGVNDDAGILAALMRRLVEHGVKPYYLHLADLAPGTSHFRTTLAEGRDIMQALRGRLSGIAQPTLVLDIPGGYGKVPAGPAYVEDALGAGPLITDPAGKTHSYPG